MQLESEFAEFYDMCDPKHDADDDNISNVQNNFVPRLNWRRPM